MAKNVARQYKYLQPERTANTNTKANADANKKKCNY